MQQGQLFYLWTLQQDGWVVLCEQPHIRLFWCPPELQNTLLFPHCLQMISAHGETCLQFNPHTLGLNWEQIYHPNNTIQHAST
ncbi:hypothetical protein C8F01DRAFT_1106558 [Mycena amicta]|nr:hypothetical protein C8F01DRAFT_1106558 [Mycena amicta]